MASKSVNVAQFNTIRSNNSRLISSLLYQSSILTYDYVHQTQTPANIKLISTPVSSIRCQPLHLSAILQNNGQEVEELRGIKRLWEKFATSVKTFAQGSKALYRDVKLVYNLNSERGKLAISNTAPRKNEQGKVDFMYSRKEVQFLFKTRQDLMKMFPTILLFLIPVLGYIVPLVVFMYPQKLLSKHFWSESQRVEFAQLNCVQSKNRFTALAEKVKLAVSEQENKLLLKIGEQLSEENLNNPKCGEEFENVVHLLKRDSAILFDLNKLPNDHMELLCEGWGVRSMMPVAGTRSRLRKLKYHINYIHTCDWLMSLEGGVDELSHKELVEACVERKLIVDPEDKSNLSGLKRKLYMWIKLSTTFKNSPIPILVHLPMTQYYEQN